MARYEKGHKDDTRKRIIEVASRKFRESGLAATGLASVMSEAGLTNGAFYVHFDSKEDLIRETIASGPDRRLATFQAAEGRAALRDAVRSYISAAHRDKPGGGCPVAAFGSEIGRHSLKTRNVLTSRVDSFIDILAEHLPDSVEASRREKATSLYCLMIGTVQLARAVGDRPMSDGILESGLKSALAVIDGIGGE